MNIEKIVEIVNNGELVIMPTDTVYGIMGDALNEVVIRDVYNVKKRIFSKPLILLMSSMEMIREYTSEISDCDVITRVDMIDDALREDVCYIEDGGEVVSAASTVIRIIDGNLHILREGMITQEIKD